MRLVALFFLTGTLWGADPAWDLHARLAQDGRTVQVEGRFSPGDADAFVVDESAAPFMRTVEVEQKGRWIPVEGSGTRWPVAGAEARGAHLRWTFDLGAAAAARGGARSFGQGYLTRTGSWVLRPESFEPGRAARLAVETPSGLAFVSGLGPGPVFETRVDDIDGGPECAFGPLVIRRFPAKGAVLAAIAPDGPLPMTEGQEARWFGLAESALLDAYGRLPLPWTAVFLVPTGRRAGILFGSTRGGGGAAIVALLGRTVADQDIEADWILTHELLHTALPDLDQKHHWLEEGLPTYLEPLLRLREGRMAPADYWRDLEAKLPQGLPRAGDRGLDRTPTWGRIYWGGALFCFVADLRIREASGGRTTLLTALRAILAGGGIEGHADIEEVLARGDAALPKPVLRPLYRAWADAPDTVDLGAIWRRLGLGPEDGQASVGALGRAWGR